MTTPLTDDIMNGWANDPHGPVALHLRQTLQPVEGPGAPIFPPTYASRQGAEVVDLGYNIDTLADGTRIAAVDSVGSQANRIEPVFREAKPGTPSNPRARLVPQIQIRYVKDRSVSIFDVGHRLGDALVRSSELGDKAKEAFETFLEHGDATGVARLAPTSLVFGVWDSRDTGARFPRIVQSTIRAHDVSPLTRSAQYDPPVDYTKLDVFTEAAQQKSAANPKSPLAQRGFVPVPSRKTHGGVIANGDIVRNVTVNLVALRRLEGSDPTAIRRYILGLSLVAASEPPDGFLRSGCLLTLDPDAPGTWQAVGRTGARTAVLLTSEVALSFATAAAQAFGVGEDRVVSFEKQLASKDAAKEKGKKDAARDKGEKGTPA